MLNQTQIMENFTMLQYFQWYYPADGSLWKKIEAEAAELKSLGIDTLWLPPAHKGAEGKNSSGYDSYDLYDLGEFEQKGSIRTKYGTKQELLNGVKAAQDAGLQVYMDIVLNHLGGADETESVPVRKVDPQNRNNFISDVYNIDAYTKFTYPIETENTLLFSGTISALRALILTMARKSRPFLAFRTSMGKGGRRCWIQRTATTITLCFQILTSAIQT